MKAWFDHLKNMRPATRWSLGIGCAAIVVLASGLAWWATRPVYGTLYQELSEQDLGQVAATLDKWHVDYRLGQDGGSIQVPEGAVADTRMRLATEGVPAHGNVGLEIFDNADYGMTEFAQKVNYQRAIQGELERTIMALKEIKFARVHVTMKQPGLFLKDEEAPKASVTIAIRQGAQLAPGQISGIQNLVAAAVEGLDPKSVIVVDDRGEALTGAQDDSAGLDARMQEQLKLESTLKQKVLAMLDGTLGLKGAAVSVSVLLNFDRIKHTEQQILTAPDGNGYVVHRQETNSEPTGGTDPAKPGTHKPAASSVVDYENGKSYEEIEYAQGRVQRVTVGVVLPTMLPPDQQQRLRDVIAAAAGLDPTRGDLIQLAAMPAGKAAEPARAQVQHVAAPQPPAASVQALPAYARWLIGALLMLLLVLFVRSPFGTRPRRTSPEQREAVLQEIQRWLGEAGK